MPYLGATFVEEEILLSEYSTFKLGGKARYFFVVNNLESLVEAFSFARDKNLPVFILGGGSNTLFSDDGFNGVVIKVGLLGKNIITEDEDSVEIEVSSGETWDDFVKWSVANNFSGIENLSGIPGVVGASVIQNIGAYGTEISSVVSSVKYYDLVLGEVKNIPNGDCEFEYRSSIFKNKLKHGVVLSVVYKLSKKHKYELAYEDIRIHFEKMNISNPSLKDIRNAVLDIRSKKMPDLSKYGTAGSYFKNVIVNRKEAEYFLNEYKDAKFWELPNGNVKISSAWVLDHVLNIRGIRVGNVGTAENQALVIVNFGGGSSFEVKNFAEEIKKKFFEKTKLNLEEEICYVGF